MDGNRDADAANRASAPILSKLALGPARALSTLRGAEGPWPRAGKSRACGSAKLAATSGP
eukprot:238481-Pyramimonas_sp.AAC.1